MAITLAQPAVSSFTGSFSFGSPVTVGNTVVVCVSSDGGGSPGVTGITIGGVADNFAQAVVAGAGGSNAAFIWWDPDCQQNSAAIVVSGSIATGSGDGGIIAFEFAGLGPAPIVDKSSSAGATGTTAWSSGSAGTTTQAAEAWVGCANTNHSLSGFPASPWTNTAPGQFATAGYQITTTTGAPVYAGTQSTSDNSGAAVVALAPAPIVAAAGLLLASFP